MRFMKSYIYWLLLFLIIFFTWVTIHEGSHAAVCSAIGGKPHLTQILPNPSINCDGILAEGVLKISSVQYFFYAIIPYILALVILIFLKFRAVNLDILYVLVTVFILDIVYNYTASLWYATDFRNMARVNVPLFAASMLITFCNIFIGCRILIERWKEFYPGIVKE